MNVRRILTLLWVMSAITPTASPADTTPQELPTASEILEMIEAKRWQPAEQALRALLAREEAPQVYDLLGIVHSQQRRFKEAEQAYTRALELDSGLLSARQHLARLYLLTQRETEAATQLRAAAAQGPLERDLATKLATLELAAGNVANAEYQLRDLANRFQSVQSLLSLARIAARQGQTNGALEHLQQALELAPNSEEVLATKARTALAARLPVPALIALAPLVRMHPSVPEYAYMLGVARMQVGELADAIEAFEAALELDPKRALTLIGLGLALNQQKRHAEAKEVLVRSLGLAPDNIEALAALAESKAGLTELDAAEQHARRALAQDANHATANLALGMVWMHRGNYAEAREVLAKVIRLDPRSAKAHYQLSLAYARLGEREASQKHLQIYQNTLKEDVEHLLAVRQQIDLDSGDTPR